ncbi:MAG: RDD family protein [Chloroflexota bacterium]
MPANQEKEAVRYAGFWLRLGAYLVDLIVLAVIDYAIYFVPGFIYFAIAGQLGSDEPAADALAGVVLALCTAASIAYPICFWWWRGQTPGKMAAGLKVVRVDGSPLRWRDATLRFLGYVVSWLTLGLLFLWVPLDDRKRGVHDRMAGTCVVRLPRRGVLLTAACEGS